MIKESKARVAWDGERVKIEIILSRRVAATLLGVVLWLYSPDLLSKISQVIETIK